jgi:hypothetical protein
VNGEVAPLPKGGEPAAGASSSSVGGSAGVTAPFEDIAKGSALLRPKLEGIPSDERWKQQEMMLLTHVAALGRCEGAGCAVVATPHSCWLWRGMACIRPDQRPGRENCANQFW